MKTHSTGSFKLMRVELSPWKLTETTLSHHLDGSDNLSIKRRKDRLTSWSREEKNFAACFIEQTSSSLRSRKKRIVKKGQSSKSITSEDEDRLPVLICTSPHRISVLVENDTSDNDTGSNQENPVPVLQESYMLQFSSRPSKGNAYLPPHNVPPSTNVQKNGKSQSSSRDFVHAIPAVYDSMRNVVFALQEGNTKLVCINASGSDQRVPNEVSLSLDYPACSLSILHIPRTKLNHSVRSFAYGSCIDGRFFVASLYMPMERELKATLKVEYIVSLDPLSASNDRSMAKHLATCATLVTNGSMVSSREGRSPKRKEVDSNFECDDSTHVLMYQIFLHGNSIWVAKCHISVATPFNYGDSIENGGTSWVNCVADNNSRCSNSVSVVHLTDSTPGKTTISDVSVLGLVEGSEVVSIFYRKSDDHNLTEKNRLPYYASISLLTFTMIDCPVPLPDDTQQIGLVGPALLAVLTSKHDVYLFDSIRKGHVYFRRKIEPIPNDSSDCLLLTDSKRSRLAVAFMRGSKFTVAFASAHATNEASMQLLLRGPRLSLAAGIASSRTLPIAPVVPRTFRLDKNLTDLEDDSDKSQVVAEGTCSF